MGVHLKMEKKVAVLMSVYNAEKYLKTCIDSVLNQSYANFLFYIINDNSTDNSLAIIKSYSDNRIRLIDNEINIGLTKSLNKALNHISAKYIARIDADDICEPTRLSSQLAVLEEDDEKLALVGSSAFLINESNKHVGEINVPIANLKENLFFKNSLIHSTIMVRTEVLKKYKYDEQIKYAQDYNLWVKIAQDYNFANIKDKLIKYRIHGASASVLKKKEQDACVLPTINYQLKSLGVLNDVERDKFAKLHLQYFVLNNETYTFKDRLNLFLYFKKIVKLNKRKEIYNEYFNKKLDKIIKKEKGILIYSLKRFILLKFGFKLVKT